MPLRQLCDELDSKSLRELLNECADDERNRVAVHQRIERLLTHALERLILFNVQLYPSARDTLIKAFISETFEGRSTSAENCRKETLAPLCLDEAFHCFDGISVHDIRL